MKILLIHTQYQIRGGEDAVLAQELSLLRKENQVEELIFTNRGGFMGLIQFLVSIWNLSVSFKVRKKIKEFDPDIVHLHNWHYAAGPLVIRTIKKRKPLVVTLHNYRLICPSATLLHNAEIFTDSLTQEFPWKAIRKKVYRNSYIQTFWFALITWFHKRIGTWNLPDRYIVLTEFSKKIFEKSTYSALNYKFIVKPNFSEMQFPDIKQSTGTNNFLFVGRLSEEKGIETLIQAFGTSGYCLNIIGEGPMQNEVVKACDKYANIKYLGRMDKNEVLSEMQAASALIFPSIWYEGMPMTIIEAFSIATPVIASDMGAMASMIDDNSNGLLFEPGNSDSLCKKLNEWVKKSHEERILFSKNAYSSYMDNYTPERNLKMLEDIYYNVIND